jgi:3-hydroxyisobutyrate dehydrogenase-like beta-hydroxyacid dehydrogenase
MLRHQQQDRDSPEIMTLGGDRVTTTDYGFIGIGRMGAHMARRLLAAGHSLIVYDTSAAAVRELVDAGAVAADSIGALCSQTKTAFLSLPTPDVVEKVCLADGGVQDGSTVKHVIDCSTTGPQVARKVSTELAASGIDYLDAPVSGGLKGAREGTLAIMVSGSKAVFDLVEPALSELGKLFYVGNGAGQGQVMKLANNLLAAAAIVLSSEALAMGVKAGLKPSQMCDIINAGSGRNSATQDKFPKSVIPRTFDFGFATGLSHKDVRLCLQEADALGVPMVAGAAVLQMLTVTKAKFGADSDFTSIARVVEEWAGVEIKD